MQVIQKLLRALAAGLNRPGTPHRGNALRRDYLTETVAYHH